MNLPDCACRRELGDDADRYFCAHPRVRSPDCLVTGEICRLCLHASLLGPTETADTTGEAPPSSPSNRCRFLGNPSGWRQCSSCSGNVRLRTYACRHPWHETTTLRECEQCPDFQRIGQRSQIREWCVGVTTAPRRETTLAQTLSSLREAGWDRPHLFAEPGVEVPREFECLPMTVRPAVRGAFSNWYLALSEMYFSQPNADAYLLSQDDVLFSKELRPYLERRLWPAPEVGVVSVYCPSHYAVGRLPGFYIEDHGWSTCGALAYLFSNPSVRRFLGHSLPVDHRHHGPAQGSRNIDSLVGGWCREVGLPYYVHAPSLAEHIGMASTLWDGPSSDKRLANHFVRDIAQLASGGVKRPIDAAEFENYDFPVREHHLEGQTHGR